MTVKAKVKQVDGAVQRMADSAHHAVDAVAGAATDAAENLHTKGEKLHATQEHMSNQVRDYIRENPMTTLALAAASGYIVSRLFGHK